MKNVIRIRKEHDVLRRFSGNCSLGLPEIQVAEPDAHTRVLRVFYAGRNHDGSGDDIVCLAVNVYWEAQSFRLPRLPGHMVWHVEADSFGTYLPEGVPQAGRDGTLHGHEVYMGPRSVLVLTAGSRQRF